MEKEEGFIVRNISAIMSSICTAAMLALAGFVVNTSKDNAVLAQQVTTLNTQVTSLIAKIDIMQMNYVTRVEFKDHEERIRALEQRKK